MRTNIDLNDDLVEEAMQATGARTKREVVERALAELVARSKRPSIAGLLGLGGLEPAYDYKAMRGTSKSFRIEETRADYVAARTVAVKSQSKSSKATQPQGVAKRASHKPTAKSSHK